MKDDLIDAWKHAIKYGTGILDTNAVEYPRTPECELAQALAWEPEETLTLEMLKNIAVTLKLNAVKAQVDHRMALMYAMEEAKIVKPEKYITLDTTA